jgi:glucosamine-6-phosphate deaminase
MFTIIVKENTQEMALAAFEVIRGVLDEKPNAVLGLATGSSPIGLYKKMIEDHQLTGRSYKKLSLLIWMSMCILIETTHKVITPL